MSCSAALARSPTPLVSRTTASGSLVSERIRIGGSAERESVRGLGAGAGSAVGLASVLLTRGREVELRQGSTIDVVFERPVVVD